MKTRHTFLLAVLALLMTQAAFAQVKGNGKVEEEKRNLSGFSAIAVEDGIDLYIRQGESETVTVKADGNLMEYIRTEVENGTLRIETTEWIRSSKKREVHVTLRNLTSLSASGGSDVFAQDGLTCEELQISASGGSDIRMRLNTEKLVLSTSGGSDTELRGEAKEMTVAASGGSDIQALDFKVANCSLSASGGSDAHIYVTGKLELQASGASDVNYKGDPEVTSLRTSGGSDVRKL